MKSYKVRANIDIYDNGKTDILYEIEPEVFVEKEEFIKWAKEKADVLEAEVEKSKKLSKKARVKAFLKKAIEMRKAKKTEGATFEAVKAEYNKKYDAMKKQDRIKYKDLGELEVIAGKAPLPPITKENGIDPFFKNLKVGDTLTTHRYAETQESASVSTYASWKVTKVSGSKFELYGGEYTKKEATGTLQIDDRGSYMSIHVKGDSTRLRAYGKEQYDIPTFESAIARRVALLYWQQDIISSQASREAKKEADWTKKTKTELVRLIDDFFEKQGKVLKGHKTADKPRLIEIIRKYKIKE